MFWTDDPVKDAESHSQASAKQVYSHCGMCGSEIYYGDSLDYGTPYYDMGDMHLCEGCMPGYMMERRRDAPCL